MRFSIGTAFLPPEELAPITKAAEAAGYHAMAVADHVITTLSNFIDDIRVVIADRAIEKNACWKLKFVQQLEQAPVSNPIAVVSPCPIAGCLRSAPVVRIHPVACAKRKMLNIYSNIEG